MRTFVYRSVTILVHVGNLADEATDAIVCPANSFAHMRGGVAGVIRESGGNEIEAEAISKAPIPVGNAIVTTAGKLNSRFVIHAPTMRLPVQRTDVDSVHKAMRAALKIADANNIQSISFPGMGTGTGWVKYEDAADSMLGEIRNHLSNGRSPLRRICIVAYSDEFYDCLLECAEKLFVKQK